MFDKDPFRCASCLNHDLQRFALSPGTLSQNLIQVQGHALLVNQSFNFGFQFVGQNSHQSLGGKPVFCSLLVIALGHVFEHIVASQIDIMDDLAQVSLEVSGGQVVQVIQSLLGNFSLPLEFTLTIIADCSQIFISVHPGNKGILELQALSGSGNFATSQGESLQTGKSNFQLFFLSLAC